MDPIDVASDVADEIHKALQENLLSALLYGQPLTPTTYKEGISTIPLFVIVKQFDVNTAKKLSEITLKWRDKGIEGPYVAELVDLEGMSDSVPDELLDITVNYRVLQGDDVLSKIIPKMDYEHSRAQAELAVRRYIYTLRWTLIQSLHDKKQMMGFLNNLAFYCQLSIRLYHRITAREFKTTEDHIDSFYREFPEGEEDLKMLFDHVHLNKPLEIDPVELSTSTIDSVLQSLLNKIDEMGD